MYVTGMCDLHGVLTLYGACPVCQRSDSNILAIQRELKHMQELVTSLESEVKQLKAAVLSREGR